MKFRKLCIYLGTTQPQHGKCGHIGRKRVGCHFDRKSWGLSLDSANALKMIPRKSEAVPSDFILQHLLFRSSGVLFSIWAQWHILPIKVRFIHSEDKLGRWMPGLWSPWSAGESKHSLLVNNVSLPDPVTLCGLLQYSNLSNQLGLATDIVVYGPFLCFQRWLKRPSPFSFIKSCLQNMMLQGCRSDCHCQVQRTLLHVF